MILKLRVLDCLTCFFARLILYFNFVLYFKSFYSPPLVGNLAGYADLMTYVIMSKFSDRGVSSNTA